MKKGTHPEMAPAHVKDFKKLFLAQETSAWVEHKVLAQWHTLKMPSAVQMTQRSSFFMIRETLEGLRHGEPHSWGGTELQFVYMSLPPSGGHRWYYNLCCCLAWLLRYLVHKLKIWQTPFAYKSPSVFLDWTPNLNCNSKLHSLLFLVKSPLKWKHHESFKEARFLFWGESLFQD